MRHTCFLLEHGFYFGIRILRIQNQNGLNFYSTIEDYFFTMLLLESKILCELLLSCRGLLVCLLRYLLETLFWVMILVDLASLFFFCRKKKTLILITFSRRQKSEESNQNWKEGIASRTLDCLSKNNWLKKTKKKTIN